MGRRAGPASVACLLRTGFLSSLFLYVLFKLYSVCLLIGFLQEAFFMHNDKNPYRYFSINGLQEPGYQDTRKVIMLYMIPYPEKNVKYPAWKKQMGAEP